MQSNWLKIFCITSMLSLSACQKPADNTVSHAEKKAGTALATEEKVLNVYNWDSYIDPDVLTEFTKETGINVVYDTFDSSETLESKLLVGKSGYDIVVPAAPFLSKQIKAGVFQKLDKSKLSNWKNFDPQTMTLLGTYDAQNQHAIPYMWGTTGLGINKAKVQAILGADAALNGFDLVFKPDNMKKLQACGVAFLDAPSEMMAAALNYLGKNPESLLEDDYKQAEQLLLSVRPYIRYFNNNQQAADLASGDICLAIGWSGDMAQAAMRADEAKNGVELSFIIPKEGAEVWIDTMAIPKDAPHPNNAHLFLDYMMRPEVIAKVTNFVAYANGNAASLPFVTPAIANDPSIYPNAEVRKRLFTVHTLPTEIDRTITRAWTKVKTGQ